MDWHSQRCDPAVVARDPVPPPVAGVARRGPAQRRVRPLAHEGFESRGCEKEKKRVFFRFQKQEQKFKLRPISFRTKNPVLYLVSSF